MLKQLRDKKTAKKILWALAIIVIPAFVLWGSGSLIRGKNKSGYAGMLFGKKISLQDYKNSYNAVRNQAKLQYGDNFAKLEKYLGLNQQAWQRLLLIHEANKRKIKVSDKKIISTIQTMPIFQENGRFSQKFYEYILHYVFGISARAFEENLRDTLRISKLYDKLTGEINISGKELEDEYKNENEQVKIDYISISPQDYRAEEKITQNEIKASKEKSKSILAELREKYQNNPGADFVKIAEGMGLKVKQTPLFKRNAYIEGIGASKEFSRAAFALEKDKISKVVETDKGFFILKLAQFVEIDKKKFEEEKEKLRDKLLTRKKQEAFSSFLQGLQTKANLISNMNNESTHQTPDE